MSYFLVVDDDKDICDVLCMILESQFDQEIVVKNSGNTAIAHLENSEAPLCILTDYRMYDGTGGDLYKYVRENKPDIPVCLISTYRAKDLKEFHSLFEDNPLNESLTKPFKPDDVVQFIERVLGCKSGPGKQEPQEVQVHYVRVNINKFLDDPVNADVFLKLSESKFVKIKDKKDGHDYESVRKYLEKNIENIYLTQEDYGDFVEIQLEKVNKELGLTIDMTSPVIQEISSVERIHDALLELGVNEKTIHLVDKTIESTTAIMEQDEDFSNILDKLDQFNSYLYAHSYMTGYIAKYIAKYVSWSGYFAKQEDLDRAFVVAALFQNISLVEDSKLAEIFSMKDSSFEKLSNENKQKVRGHTIDSYNEVKILVTKYKHIGNMIVNHHEQPDGSGFPAGLSASDMDLHEAIFIIACNFAHDMLKPNMSKNDLKILAQDYNEKYDSQDPYKAAYRAFLKAFNQIFS